MPGSASFLRDKQKAQYGSVKEICSQVNAKSAVQLRCFLLFSPDAQMLAAADSGYAFAQVETRFGTKVMVCQSVMSSAEALRLAVMTETFQDKDVRDKSNPNAADKKQVCSSNSRC